MDVTNEKKTDGETKNGTYKETQEKREQILSERYIIWRKNAPFLYHCLLKYTLDWPSLSIEFLGAENSFKSKINYFTNKILLGTHTSNQDCEYAYIGEIRWPVYSLKEDVLCYENYTGYLSIKKKKKKIQTIPAFEIKAKLLHPGNVVRATHMPNNPFFIVTQTENGNILLFDYSKHPSFPSDTSTSYPQMILSGHTGEGTGLCWNYNKIYDYSKGKTQSKGKGSMKNKTTDVDKEVEKEKEKEKEQSSKEEEYGSGLNPNDILLASCSADGSICLWDVEKGTKSNNVPRSFGLSKNIKSANCNAKICENVSTITPLCTWINQQKRTPLNDIFFHPQFKTALSVCDDDGCLHIYDIRKKSFFTKPEITFQDTSNNSMNTFSFDNYFESIFVTGHSNGIINLWDLRNNKESILKLDYHTDSINRVSFCLASSGIFGSCSDDGTACIWDISRDSSKYEGICKTEDDYYNSWKMVPKELLFVHGGHIGSVIDLSWANCNTFLAATVGIDNTLQVWQLNEQFLMR